MKNEINAKVNVTAHDQRLHSGSQSDTTSILSQKQRKLSNQKLRSLYSAFICLHFSRSAPLNSAELPVSSTCLHSTSFISNLVYSKVLQLQWESFCDEVSAVWWKFTYSWHDGTDPQETPPSSLRPRGPVGLFRQSGRHRFSTCSNLLWSITNTVSAACDCHFTCLLLIEKQTEPLKPDPTSSFTGQHVNEGIYHNLFIHFKLLWRRWFPQEVWRGSAPQTAVPCGAARCSSGSESWTLLFRFSSLLHFVFPLLSSYVWRIFKFSSS